MSVRPDFDPARLEAALGGPVALAPVASGQSNPTWFVTHAGRRLVLRKKPSGAVLDSAHAVEREYRVMAALAGSGVPVPAMLRLEEDPAVIGAPFYLMERMDGTVCEDSAATALPPGARGALHANAAAALARLHRVDWRAAGLEGFGREGGYYARQTRRWTRQLQQTPGAADPSLDRMGAWFAANLPPETPTTLVHGDFRIGNLMADPADGRLVAVLDWELSTLGDPLADLAHWCMFYELAPDQLGGLAGLDLDRLGIPCRARFLDLYRAAGGAEAPLTAFHRGFAFWRMAIIFAGIAARARGGQSVHEDAARVGALAPVCARLAEDALSAEA